MHPNGTESALLVLLDEMAEMQRKKVLALARRLRPGVTPEDVLNPHDFPELLHDPQFNYEDGQLAGLIAAAIAVRARLRNLK